MSPGFSEHVRYRVADRIAEITLDRPPVNALDIPTVEGLIAAFQAAGDDPAVGAVLLCSGQQKRFSAGFALDLARGISAQDMSAFLSRLYVKLFDVQYRLGKPSIAVVGGSARGAGVTLAISCDMIIAGGSATFGYSEIDIGLMPAIHFVHLPRIIGRHRAFELLFSGRAFGAAEAVGLGLINKMVSDDALMDEARAVAAMFAKKSPAVMRMGRNAFMRANDLDYRRSMEDMVDALSVNVTLADTREGFDAFLQKRPPIWPSMPGDGE